VKENDPAQAGLPFETVDGDRLCLALLPGMVQNYEIFQHGAILGRRKSRLS
jgi:hypothetical protein